MASPEVSVPTYRNPVVDMPGKDHGDPFVLETPEGYVLYHTGRDGIAALVSTDLVSWQPVGQVLGRGGVGHWAQVDFWAPEVVLRDGEYLMYVAATSRQPDGKADDDARKLGLARSHAPLGPFSWDDEPVIQGTWAIDGHPYRDPDGADWLFYNIRDDTTRYVDGSIGCGNAVDRLIRPDRPSGQPNTVLAPDRRWEGNRAGDWYWNEGPWVTRRDDRLVQMYSGGWFADETYGVGVAVAGNPRGPWKKDPRNPLLRTGPSLRGPGHNCLVLGPDGISTYAVYHAHKPAERRRVIAVERLHWLETAFSVGSHEEVPSLPSEGPHPVPSPAVHDADVPHWRRSVWLSGGRVTLAGTRVDLTGGGPHHLTLTYASGVLSARLDGRNLDLTGTSPDVRLPEGGVLRDTLSSALADEQCRDLAGGQHHSWAWGGGGPVEASLSVCGDAVVRLGDSSKRVRSDTIRWVSLTGEGGASDLSIEALGQSRVGDVELVARPRR